MLGQHQKFICDRLQKACKHEDRAWEDGIVVNDAIPQSGFSFEALMSRTSFQACTATLQRCECRQLQLVLA